MSDVMLSEKDYATLQNVVNAARELCAIVPYIVAAGGQLSARHPNIVTLSNAIKEAEEIARIIGVPDDHPNRSRTRSVKK